MTEQKASILIVDNSPGGKSILNLLLESAGYLTLTADGGEAALALIARQLPDLILLDAVMPGLDGFETCRRLKALPALASIPVVFMTGLTETEHVVRGFQAGGVD